MHHENVRGCGEHGDRSEVLQRVIRELLESARVDAMRVDRRHQERVAVWGALGDRGGTDIPARSATILDDEVAAEALAETVAHKPRENVGGTPRGIGDYDLDDAVRVLG